jgi:RNA polymerase sigma-70 factor (ECF subfamily)
MAGEQLVAGMEIEIGQTESDASVIARSLTEPEAFALIFERYFDDIYRYLRRRFPEQAEEIASDVFLVAFDKRARYRPVRGSARPWLYGIASNLLYKRRRSERRSLAAYAQRSGKREPVSIDSTEFAERLDAERQSATIAAALAQLRRQDRDTLLLYALAELSYDEVALALKVPVGTVRSRLARARRQCTPALHSVTEQDDDDDDA